MRGKSVRKDVIEAEFDELMRSLRPSKVLFSVLSQMLKELWEDRQQSLHVNQREIENSKIIIDRKIAKLVERVVATESVSLMATYENSIKELDAGKDFIERKNQKMWHSAARFR